VLGAMDTMYQRSRIQDESMYYEHKKHDGSLPIIGVNTFKGDKEGHIEGGEQELMRSTEKEKNQQVSNVEEFREFHQAEAKAQLKKLQKVAWERGNTFEALMEAAKCCSLGSMSHALYEVGGEYRRNM
jgi:methylmalonyl-CoA mutase